MSNTPFDLQKYLGNQLKATTAINRGSWQSVQTDLLVRETSDVLFEFDVPATQREWGNDCLPNMPWAETHFQERVSGKPMNPAPSYIDWPWHSGTARDRFMTAGNGEKFDHTYPERFWPKYEEGYDYDGDRLEERVYTRHGIRFDYGDLGDVVKLLAQEPFTRQAYLPIFFPEDTGSTAGQRVPCSLGYHFIREGSQLNVKYFLRSCDLTRHFLNDVYMTGRLLQWVVEQLPQDDYQVPHVGKMVMFVSNLHMFVNDEWRFV